MRYSLTAFVLPVLRFSTWTGPDVLSIGHAGTIRQKHPPPDPGFLSANMSLGGLVPVPEGLTAEYGIQQGITNEMVVVEGTNATATLQPNHEATFTATFTSGVDLLTCAATFTPPACSESSSPVRYKHG